MIFIHWKFWTFSCIGVLTLITLSAFYAYQVNANREPDDPEKKDYYPSTPWLAPIILPLLVLIDIPLFILSSILFGIFLVLFPFSLLLIRKPFLFKWIRKQALKIGNMVLKINTEVLRLVGFSPPVFRFQFDDKFQLEENTSI